MDTKIYKFHRLSYVYLMFNVRVYYFAFRLFTFFFHSVYFAFSNVIF